MLGDTFFFFFLNRKALYRIFEVPGAIDGEYIIRNLGAGAK